MMLQKIFLPTNFLGGDRKKLTARSFETNFSQNHFFNISFKYSFA